MEPTPKWESFLTPIFLLTSHINYSLTSIFFFSLNNSTFLNESTSICTAQSLPKSSPNWSLCLQSHSHPRILSPFPSLHCKLSAITNSLQFLQQTKFSHTFGPFCTCCSLSLEYLLYSTVTVGLSSLTVELKWKQVLLCSPLYPQWLAQSRPLGSLFAKQFKTWWMNLHKTVHHEVAYCLFCPKVCPGEEGRRSTHKQLFMVQECTLKATSRLDEVST